MHELDERASGQTIRVRLGERVQICLEENMTTGFRWQLVTGGEPACALVDEDVRSADGRPGAGGRRCWTLEAQRPGQGRVELVYRRPWERDRPPGRTFAIRLEVEG